MTTTQTICGIPVILIEDAPEGYIVLTSERDAIGLVLGEPYYHRASICIMHDLLNGDGEE